MWLKLTNHNGELVKVNMNCIANYFEHIEGGGNTFLEYPCSSSEGIHVRENVTEIENALIHADHPLRLVPPVKWN